MYVEYIDGQERRRKAWNYRLVGRLIDQWGTAPKASWNPSKPGVVYDGDREVMMIDHEFQGGPRQALLNEVTTWTVTVFLEGVC